jgi:phenylpropionate dioxygenase-like ring-hydroxylating dioxygenase large terminal subunit
MRRDVQDKLILQLKHFIDTNETTLVDTERLNPTSEYWDPERMDSERSILFRTHPIAVAHASELPGEGQYVVDDLSGVSVLVVSGPQHSLRGFIRQDSEPGLGLSESELVTFAASFSSADDYIPAVLVEIPVEARHGIIWAHLDTNATIDVASFLGTELDAELTSFALDAYPLERTHFFHEQLNWKSVIDGFLENYHVRYLHAETLAKFLRSNVHVYDEMGQHARLAVIKTTFDKVKDLPVSEYDPLKHMSVVYQIFPNTIISWVGDHFETWTSIPDRDEPSRSKPRFILMAPADRVDDHAFWDRSMKTVLEVIPTEDFEMSRMMQLGLPAMAQTHQVFGRNEGALQHFHIELERVLGPAR